MKCTKTYVGAAGFFERFAGDGWPEDAGEWPERCNSQMHLVGPPDKALQKRPRLSPVQFIMVLLRSRKQV